MRVQKGITIVIFILVLVGCGNLDETDLTKRITFIHFYEKSVTYKGVIAEPLTDGYLLAGNIETSDERSSIVTKTDFNGKLVWESTIQNCSTKALKVVSDGYLILGDSIEIDNEATQVADREVTKLRLIKMSLDGQIVIENSLFNKNSSKVDFHGDALTLDGTGTIITIGSFQPLNSNTKSLVAAFDPATFDTLWTQSYSLIDRDYSNAKSAYVNSSQRIIWASSAQIIQPNNSRSYITIPTVEPNSTFVNSDLFGESENQFYNANDITNSGIGYGVVGTYKNIQGQNANMYFLRTDPAGNVLPNSEVFFDGELSVTNERIDKSSSATQDTGDAIASTSDGGYIIAGSMTSTLSRGNGGKDIFLVRVDPFGNLLWNKVIGGTGDEEPSSIRVTADGGFLLCGTVTVNGLSSIFLVRTDRDGNLED